MIDSSNNFLEPITGAHRFSHRAMATVYEIFIIHEDASYAQQAAHQAFSELDRLEQELSRFIPNSDIARVNKLRADESLTLGEAAFECLQLSAQMHKETAGAFDVTIGPLLKCWMNPDKTPRLPSDDELNEAGRRSGFHLLQLDENARTVTVLRSPVHVDLGGIGKGYAVDQMAHLLRDWDIDTALIHGGTSSVLALGAPTGQNGWPITLSGPDGQILSRLFLRNQALGGSGVQKGQHIIDPRIGRPVTGNLAAWASTANAAISDALSTAFMIMSPKEIEEYCQWHPEVSLMIVTEEKVLRFGLWKNAY
jgi:thiamine biosynthesis lipoprotein